MSKEELAKLKKHDLDVYLRDCNRQKQVSTGEQMKLIKRRTETRLTDRRKS